MSMAITLRVVFNWNAFGPPDTRSLEKIVELTRLPVPEEKIMSGRTELGWVVTIGHDVSGPDWAATVYCVPSLDGMSCAPSLEPYLAAGFHPVPPTPPIDIQGEKPRILSDV